MWGWRSKEDEGGREEGRETEREVRSDKNVISHGGGGEAKERKRGEEGGRERGGEGGGEGGRERGESCWYVWGETFHFFNNYIIFQNRTDHISF